MCPPLNLSYQVEIRHMIWYDTHWINSFIFLFSSFVSNWLVALASILVWTFWNIFMLTASTLTVMYTLRWDLASVLPTVGVYPYIICNLYRGGHSSSLTLSSLHASQHPLIFSVSCVFRKIKLVLFYFLCFELITNFLRTMGFKLMFAHVSLTKLDWTHRLCSLSRLQ